VNVDTALQEREVTSRPIRVAMVGAGATGRAIALQLGTPVPGIRLVQIALSNTGNGHSGRRGLPIGFGPVPPTRPSLQSLGGWRY
jgi:predicted homoserine dehydrogenase-like protein